VGRPDHERKTKVVNAQRRNGFFFSDVRRYLDENVVIIAMSNQPMILPRSWRLAS